MTNIMTFTYRKICDLLPKNKYKAKIVDASVYTKDGSTSMIVNLVVDGGITDKLKINKWFPDSPEDEKIKERKEFFEALGHPEWFNIKEFNIEWLKGKELIVDLDQYTKSKGPNAGKIANVINKFLPSNPFNTSNHQVDNSLPNDDITF